jgi:lipopolysaccharide export system permease protein
LREKPVRILDSQRYWSFLKAYVICYVSLVGLYVVIDAFSNLDEFTKRADGVIECMQIMARYYTIHQSQFFDQLSGVIGMMAAIFTVTWMQRNNEQLAMLAAGISTYRAIRPVLVSSVIVGLLVVANQELVMPRFAEDLSKTHDDDGVQKVHVSSRYDPHKIMIHGNEADRATRTIMPFYSTIPVGVYGKMHDIKAIQATYVPPDHPTAPLKGGWLIRRAVINPPLDDAALQENSSVLSRVVDLEGFPPAYVQPKGSGQAGQGDLQRLASLLPHTDIAYLVSLPAFPVCLNPAVLKYYVLMDHLSELDRGDYFLKSSLTFQAMTRKPTWYQFAPTFDLIQGLTDPSTTEGSERLDIATFVHIRLLRPVLAMNLLFMSLPLVLGGYGRNTFINLGFALGNSAMFYGAIIFCQYLASFTIVSPELAAWLPLIVFGTIATLRWGQIRT